MSVKVIFCGDRSWRDWAPIKRAMNALQQRHGSELVILTGDCKGADMLARSWCVPAGIEHELVEADWPGLGNMAGPVRNQEMIERDPIAVYAFKDPFDWTLARGKNGGHTEGTCRLAIERLIPVHVCSKGKWASLPLLANLGLDEDWAASIMETAIGRERARAALDGAIVINTYARSLIFRALTDAENALGENP